VKLLRVPVFLFLETVLGNEKGADAGELDLPVHGDRRAGGGADGRPAAEASLVIKSRPDRDQGPRNKDTLSLAVLLKSPWRTEYSTRGPGVLEEFTLSSVKSVFSADSV
jgi:hypothetical protein